jgi:cytochrome c-type biogenesis protein CcmH/NrfG
MTRVEPEGSDRATGHDLRVLRLLLTLLLLLQAGAAFLPGPLLWGASHLAYAPLFARLLVPLLGVAILWTPLGHWAAARAGRLGALLLSKPAVAYGVVPLAAMALFWLLRTRLHFLGDGWLLGELVHLRVRFHGFDFLDYLLHARLYGWLGLQSEPAAFRLFAVVSVLAGGFYVAAAAWSARKLDDTPAGRLLLFALLLCASPVQMFMGYVECYARLAVLLLVFLTLLTLYYRGRVSLVAPAGAFALALAVHLDALILSPLLIAPLLWPPAGRRAPRSRRALQIAVPVLAGAALAAGLLLLAGYNARWFRIDFIEKRTDHPLLLPLSDGLLSWRHWKDFANLLWLLAAVPLAMILARLPGWLRRGGGGPRREGGGPRNARLAAALMLGGCAWVALWMLLLHLRLGVARDWDLFAAPALVFCLAGFLMWQEAGERVRAELAVIIGASALVLVGPWFWLNAGEARSLARFRDVIADLPKFPRAYAHEEIGKYFRKAGDIAEARREYEACVAIHPSNPRFLALLAALLYNAGENDAALQRFTQVYELDSTNVSALEMLARIHAEKEEYAQALGYARRLAGRSRERAAGAVLHGTVAARLGLYPEAVAAYERALRVEPDNLECLELLGNALLLSGDHARAEQAFRALLGRDAGSASALFGLVASLWMPCEGHPEDCTDERARARLREALALLDRLELMSGGPSQQLQQWRGRIAAVLARGPSR